MTALCKIDGLSSFAITRLKKAGIRTMEGLLDAAQSASARKSLAGKTGFSEQQLLEWANLADCLRVPGMGLTRAELLRRSGVNTVRDLAHRNPGRLALAMREANDRHKLLRVAPSEKAVGQMIDEARKLPLKISY